MELAAYRIYWLLDTVIRKVDNRNTNQNGTLWNHQAPPCADIHPVDFEWGILWKLPRSRSTENKSEILVAILSILPLRPHSLSMLNAPDYLKEIIRYHEIMITTILDGISLIAHFWCFPLSSRRLIYNYIIYEYIYIYMIIQSRNKWKAQINNPCWIFGI